MISDSLVIFLVILAAGVAVLIAFAIFNPSQLARIRGRQPERDVEDIRDGANHQDSYMLEVRRKNQQDIMRSIGIRDMRGDSRAYEGDHSHGHYSSSGMMTPGSMPYTPGMMTPGSMQYTPGPADATLYEERMDAPRPAHVSDPSSAGKAGYFVQSSSVPGP
nr:hypothetical protein CFP56_57900 [Quercus suber]